MFDLRTPLFAALATASMLAAACGDNNDAPPPDAPVDTPAEFDEDGCRILTLGQREFQFNIFEQLLGVRFPITPNLESGADDTLRVELYDSSTPDLPPLTTGTFDLATETSIATCQHCVWVDVDESDDGTIDTIYLATQGSITIDKVEDPLGYVFAAHMSGRVVLRRATVGDNGETTLVPNGDCVSFTDAAFDTTPTPGASCESAEDCGNALLEICDPSNNTCGDFECNFDSPCEGEGEVCLIQYGDLFDGACYQTCDATAAVSSCPANTECVQRGVDPVFGTCKYTGDGALGEACTLEDNSTSCATDTVCSAQSETCVSTCSFFAADTGCADGSSCSIFWRCEPPSIGIDVGFGQACGASAELAQGCANDGEAFRGLCFAYESDPLKCEKACYIGEGCGSGEFCAQRFSTGIGICLPNPVCGDGILGEINEVCDDGNQVNTDGCTNDCQTVNTAYLCDTAPTLALNTTTDATTLGANDGLQATCQPGLARANLYEVAPPGPGRLKLTLTSNSAQALSLRSDCEDVQTELVCRGELGVPTTQELIVQVTNPTPTPFTAMISAMTVLEEGDYSLTTEFIAEDCGDGTTAGREACDDMNTNANDGCSADCRAIEYSYYCTQAPALSTSSLNSGTLAGAPLLYAATCAADDGAEIHPTRTFTYTAPSAGNLHLKLNDGSADFAILTVRDGCGTPDASPELACRPGFLNGEIDLALTAGQDITVVVSSYFREQNLGDFTLEATFTP